MAREVLGRIECDPFTSDYWNLHTMKAEAIFTAEEMPRCAVVGVGALADELNITTEQLAELWAQLERGMPGFAQYDRVRRVLRVRGVPKIGHRPNQNVIRGWWRCWRALPESPLKYAHIEPLREAVADDAKDAVLQAWGETFGSVQLADVATDEPMRAATVAPMDDVIGEPTDDVIGGPTDSGYDQCSPVSVVAPESGGKSPSCLRRRRDTRGCPTSARKDGSA